jgi:hypothetical protein
MLDRRSRLVSIGAFVALLMLAVVGCSNSTGTPSAAASASAAVVAPSASASASASVAASASPDDTGTTSAACDLLPAADVASALGTGTLTATGSASANFSYCNYATADGSTVAATSFTSVGGAQAFESTRSAQGAVPVPGVGDGAVISGGVVYINKGDALFSFQPLDTSKIDPAKFLDIATKVGTKVTGGM